MIGIIGAMEAEAEKIEAMLEHKTVETFSGISFFKGTIYEKEVVIAVCGIGKVFAALCAQTMILRYHPSKIINIGVAGTLTNRLNIADIAIAENVVQHDMDASKIGFKMGQIPGMPEITVPCDPKLVKQIQTCVQELGIPFLLGTIASGDQFVADQARKDAVVIAFHAIACEMEGAAIGQVCSINEVGFAVIRAISDSADQEATMNFEEFTKVAADNSAKVMSKLMQII